MATFPTPIHPSEKRRPKYGNKKTVVGGLTFDSKKEADRWNELLILEKAGEIDGLVRQVPYRLEVNGFLVCTYVADALYFDRSSRSWVTEDVKGGPRTRVYAIKKKLMLACHGIEIREV